MGTSGRDSLWRVKIDFIMMTSSNGSIFRLTGPLCGEFTGHRWIPLTKAGDMELRCFFDLRLNKWLSKQSWGWWSETPPRSLWRHCNHAAIYLCSICNITVFDLIDSGNIFFSSRDHFVYVPSNERWCYIVICSLIGWTHAQNDSWVNLLDMLQIELMNLVEFYNYFTNLLTLITHY